MDAIKIQNLNKSYKDFELKNINLTLPKGCIMGLIGENGAGKSTIIKLILNMIKQDNGTIEVLGKSNDIGFELTKEDIGAVLDDVGFPDCLTVRQINNIMKHTYKKWDEKTYFDYISKLKIPENMAFKDFSRGMKMKLGITAALSHSPKLLILDEATNGLDPVIRDEVTDIFNEFTRDENNSILISSHIISDLEKLCDYIAFLHNGQLILCEEKDKLTELFGMIHCVRNQLTKIPPRDIIGIKSSAYGASAVVRRCSIPQEIKVSPVSIEELFVFMVKEEQ